VSIFFIVLAVVIGLLLLTSPKDLPPMPYPWCGVTTKKGYYRCHRPKGHQGHHSCDDMSGEFTWTD